MNQQPQTKAEDILIVDDTAANLNVLSAMLTPQGYTVRPAISGELAIKAAQKAPPDLILLDIRMPDISGYQVCEQLKSDERTRDIPIIFISALNDIEDKLKAFRAGGVDYVNKPFYIEEVIARVEIQLTLQRQRREIGRLRDQDRRYFEQLGQLKDQFVTIASHDLKSPLSMITGYASLLEGFDSVTADPDALEHVQAIQRGAVRMQRLITDLLDLAQIETGFSLNLIHASLAEFLSECVADAALRAHDKHVELLFTPPPPEVSLNIDQSKMAQVMDNLLSNAIKYTPANGRIELSAAQEANEILIRVADTGIGIPPEAMPRLFERFYRVPRGENRSIDGTGLGLSIVKAVVEQHQGQIWVESEVGKGSIFYVALPTNLASQAT